MHLEIRFNGFEQALFLDQKPFVAKIYDGGDGPPDGFNVVRISLDTSDCSLLQWQTQLEFAKRMIQKGLLILWELEFDLFGSCLGIEDDARFLTLQLNVQHFNDVVWALFREHTFGVAIYRGTFHEQDCNAIVRYLKLLAASLPEEVGCFVFLDTSSCDDSVTYLRLVNQEVFGHLHLILTGHFAQKYPWAVPALAWRHFNSALGYCSLTPGHVLSQKRISYGLCLQENGDNNQIYKAVEAFGATAFRVIPEKLLTHEWDGIDHLLIFPDSVTDNLRRKLYGFIAAGGSLINFPDDAASLPLLEKQQLFSPVFLQ